MTMFLFLIPLLVGFLFNSASAFTTYYSKRFGKRGGRLIVILLRDVLGIPVWAIGYILAARSASPLLFNPILISSTLGWFSILAGGVIILISRQALGWRALAPSVTDTLVEHGIYTHVRHPVYSGMFLELCGVYLIIPTLTVFVACLLGVIWVIIQARLEELDLVERLPVYKEYMQRVPRFIPRLRLH